MDVSGQVGGAMTRRRRGRRGTKRAAAHQHGGGEEEEMTAVIKETAATPSVVPNPNPNANPIPTPTPSVPQVGGAKKPAPVVVLAPAKKKQTKVLLVPKGKSHAVRPAKTFKAKRVSVTIDNTAKTQKHRRQVMQRVEAMTDDQIRAAAVGARLSRRESVAKAPVTLLRQMVKDYQTMRGMFL